MKFIKAHAYGNDFLYVRRDAGGGSDLPALARAMCARQTGVGADGLIVYEPTTDGASMELFNADGSRAEVSGNGVRGLAAILAAGDRDRTLAISTEGGLKTLARVTDEDGKPAFRAAMGLPEHLRQERLLVAGDSLDVAMMTFGNPQCVVLGHLPDDGGFRRIGAALERHERFPNGTNVEFAEVLEPARVRILIWERGVGPTMSSGTGSCAALIAASAFGTASRDAIVIAPGGAQRVEWRAENVFLTGWAEVLFEGTWLKNPRT